MCNPDGPFILFQLSSRSTVLSQLTSDLAHEGRYPERLVWSEPYRPIGTCSRSERRVAGNPRLNFAAVCPAARWLKSAARSVSCTFGRARSSATRVRPSYRGPAGGNGDPKQPCQSSLHGGALCPEPEFFLSPDHPAFSRPSPPRPPPACGTIRCCSRSRLELTRSRAGVPWLPWRAMHAFHCPAAAWRPSLRGEERCEDSRACELIAGGTRAREQPMPDLRDRCRFQRWSISGGVRFRHGLQIDEDARI